MMCEKFHTAPTAAAVKCALKQPRFHAWHHQKLHIKTGQLPLTITDCLKWSHSWAATCFLLYSQTAFSCENLPGPCNSHSFTSKWAHQMGLISLWCKNRWELHKCARRYCHCDHKADFLFSVVQRKNLQLDGITKQTLSVMNNKSKGVTTRLIQFPFHLSLWDWTWRKFKKVCGAERYRPHDRWERQLLPLLIKLSIIQ